MRQRHLVEGLWIKPNLELCERTRSPTGNRAIIIEGMKG